MAEHTPEPKLCPKCGERQPDTQDWFGEAVRLKVVNEKLVAALEDAIKLINDINGCHGCANNTADEDHSRRNALAAALAKAKEPTSDESRLQQQDLDEETL